MSKNSGMGSKRIGSMTSKGMGKCDAGTRAEQCGNERVVKKGANENLGKIKPKNLYTPDQPLTHPEHLTVLQDKLYSLELDLNKIREKLLKIKGD